MKHITVLLLSVALSGCYTPNHTRLSANLGQRVTVGTPLSTATENLAQEGFACDGTSQAPDMVCGRNRSGGLLYTCIERVVLKVDAATRVTEVNIPPIACAGL